MSTWNQSESDTLDFSKMVPAVGEIVAEIYRAIHVYNTQRIHSALKMSPLQNIDLNKEISMIVKD